MIRLDDIGFYTLSENRAMLPDNQRPLARCELIVTDRCNFRCPYCRGSKAYSRNCSGHIDFNKAQDIIDYWVYYGIKAVRFSGGEPLLYPWINEPVECCGNIERIAISSNGSLPQSRYRELISAGVNDFSISLDACCADGANKMSGVSGIFETVIENIKYVASQAYTTVGIVLTPETLHTTVDVIKFADSLGVADIRIITSAQYNGWVMGLNGIPKDILAKYPLLRYRVNNLLGGINVRGIGDIDCNRCHIVRDDMAIAGDWHFPCVIYMREGGEPIGEARDGMIEARRRWAETHNTHNDPICKKNCLDCLVEYNNHVTIYKKRGKLYEPLA